MTAKHRRRATSLLIRWLARPERARVTMHPGWAFGRPCVGGVSTQAVAGMVAAGETLATVADEYKLSREEVVLACWREAEPDGAYAAEWRGWLDTWFVDIAHDASSHLIPGPPALGQVQP